MILKLDGLKTKRNFHPIKKLSLFFFKVRKYKNKYRTKICDFILCVNCAWWEREQERQAEKDGSAVTIVALQLAMSSHFPFPNIHTLRLLGLQLSNVHHCGAKMATSSHLPVPKNWHSSFRLSCDRRTENKNDWMAVRHFSHRTKKKRRNQINTKNSVGNRKRDCA